MTEMIAMDMFGNLEDAPDNRMVVRILGHRVGTSDGWFHGGGHTVVLPEFKMEPGFRKFAPDVDDVADHTALMIDYYAGFLALIPHAAQGSTEQIEMVPVWTATLSMVLP